VPLPAGEGVPSGGEAGVGSGIGYVPEAAMFGVPFADGKLEFELPEGMRGTLLAAKAAPVLEGWRAVHDGLRDPVGSPPLRGLVKEGDRVCIVVPDATSACPDRLLAPPLVTSLELAGV